MPRLPSGGEVESALEELADIGDVSVSGTAPAWTITWDTDRGDLPALVVSEVDSVGMNEQELDNMYHMLRDRTVTLVSAQLPVEGARASERRGPPSRRTRCLLTLSLCVGPGA